MGMAASVSWVCIPLYGVVVSARHFLNRTIAGAQFAFVEVDF